MSCGSLLEGDGRGKCYDEPVSWALDGRPLGLSQAFLPYVGQDGWNGLELSTSLS